MWKTGTYYNKNCVGVYCLVPHPHIIYYGCLQHRWEHKTDPRLPKANLGGQSALVTEYN